LHLAPYLLELWILAFALTGALIAWLTRWHIMLAALAASALLFACHCILHLADDDTVSLLVADGPLMFYAFISLAGTVPAIVGAGVVRLIQRWRSR
jgi:hypothetical protein